jgi:hypothetical protein
MKTFASTHSCTQNKVKEHTPIDDLNAYLLRQRKLKHKKLLKNFVEATVFISMAAMTFSILFWGA